MATVRQYGYYIKGNKVAIVEKDTQFDNDVNSKDYGPGSDRAQWKSPLADVADGIELEYVYSPLYNISKTYRLTSLTGYMRSIAGEGGTSEAGMLKLVDASSLYDNYDNVLDVGDKFLLKNAGRWNGIHEVALFLDSIGTNNIIVTNTPVNDVNISTTVVVDFEDTPYLYFNIEYLNDENDNIDLTSYLSKSLVYYVKARLAEDAMNIEAKEYFMAEFRKMVEKHNNTRVAGLRIQSSGFHAIR